jgi:hypothetical protein
MHPILVTVAALSATNYRRYARLTYIFVLLHKTMNSDVNKSDQVKNKTTQHWQRCDLRKGSVLSCYMILTEKLFSTK